MQLRPCLRSGPALAFALAFALALVLVPACIGDPPPTATDEYGVIGGTMTPEGLYPGVGSLYDPTIGSMCTGTLIAPNVVLTAAHCVDPDLAGPDVPGFTLVHDTVTSQPAFTPGMRKVKHSMFVFDPGNPPGPGVATWYDIGLLFLAQDITSVEPIRLPSPTEIALLTAGLQLHLVGYGRTSNDTFDNGIMFNAMTDLVTVGTTELQISTPGNPQNCHGDSGGPALYDFGHGFRVVGVVSRSADGSGECLSGGIDTRVDAYLGWIDTEAPIVCIPPDPACTVPAPGPDADDGNPVDGDGGGCCSTSRDGGVPSLVLALAVGVVIFRGRMRRRFRAWYDSPQP